MQAGKRKIPALVTEGLCECGAYGARTIGRGWGRKAGRGGFPKGTSQRARVSILKPPRLPRSSRKGQERHCHSPAAKQTSVSNGSFSTSVLQCLSPHGAQTAREGQELPLPGWGFPAPVPRKHPAEVHTLLRPRGCVPCARALCGAKQSHRSLQRRGVNTNSSVFSVKQQTEPRHLSPEPGTSYDQQPGPGSPASPSHCNQPSPKIINSRLFLHLLSRKTALISCFVRLYHASTILA